MSEPVPADQSTCIRQVQYTMISLLLRRLHHVSEPVPADQSTGVRQVRYDLFDRIYSIPGRASYFVLGRF